MTRFRIFEQKIRILTKKSGHRQNLKIEINTSRGTMPDPDSPVGAYISIPNIL